MKDLLIKAGNIYNDLLDIRRHLHRNPELGFKEYNTSNYLQNKLSEIGIEFKNGVAGPGILAQLGNDPGKKTIGLRADMDALPITEKTGLDFSSGTDGMMHACGHDMHMTCLTGALMILKEFESELPVNVKAIYQPAEEVIVGGAIEMIKEGALKNPEVSSIFGLHMEPFYPTGVIAVRAGPMMASTAAFTIKIIGKGGHAAKPFTTIDPINIAANIITALQSVVSRMTNPLEPGVISVTQINAGSTFNIIPDEAEIKGTIRALNKKTDKMLPEKLEEIVKGVVKAFGADYELEIKKGTNVLDNDAKMTEHVEISAAEVIGKENVKEYECTFGGEDFAAYLNEIPGCFFRLGCAKDPANAVSLHNPTFDPDENALKFGTAILANIILSYGK